MTFSSGNAGCGEYGPASHTNRKPPDTEAEPDAESDPGDACERSVDVFLYRVHGVRVPVRVPVVVVVVAAVAVWVSASSHPFLELRIPY